jgi:hypothetical protein
MAVLLDGNGCLYHPEPFSNEADFEKSVVALADEIFGPSSIYVDVKKRVRGKEIVTIPDGYVIDMTEADNPKLFVIENEIVSHDPFQHIGIQMLKFVTSFDDAKLAVRTFLMEDIAKHKEKLARLDDGCSRSTSRNIDNYLDQAVYGDFRGIVVIDDARPELHRVLEKIYANISVLELKRFESDDGQRLFLFDTLYDEYDDEAMQAGDKRSRRRKKVSRETQAARRARRAASDTIIVPAREEGFLETFLGENRWYAIRIGAAMKERIKYIATYQVAPVSAVTYIAEVQEIRPYRDTGKYLLTFKEPAHRIGPIPVKDVRYAPQSPVYVQREKLEQAECLEDALQ